MTLDADAPSEVSGMPPGFKLLRAVQRSLPGQAERTVRHMVFSDGLVMLSLFIEPQD
jgi:sigma-E factor negative regulatory protein RseB